MKGFKIEFLEMPHEMPTHFERKDRMTEMEMEKTHREGRVVPNGQTGRIESKSSDKSEKY